MTRQRVGFERLETRILFAWDTFSLQGLVFEPPASTPLASSQTYVQAAALIDLDADGDRDLVFTHIPNEISVALSRGGADFGTPTQVALAKGSADRIVAGDLNHDGANDVVIVGSNQMTSLITQRSGDGQWQGFVIAQSIPLTATSLELGDVDRDGHLDLIVGRTGRVEVRLGTETGTFRAATRYTSQPGDRTTALGDLDRDGDLDLIVGVGDPDRVGSQVVVLQNNGEGVFETQTDAFPVGDPPATLAIADLDANGTLDLVIGHAAQENGNLSVWLGQGNGTLSHAPRRFEILGAPRHIEFAHIDRDRILDIVVAHSGTFHHPINGNGPGGVSILIGIGTGSYHDATRISTPDALTVAASDIDNDGEADITSVSYQSVSVFRSRPRHTYLTQAEKHQAMEFGYGQTMIADLNQDGHPDIISAAKAYSPEQQPTQLSVMLGTADGRFQPGPQVTMQLDVHAMFVGNFDADAGMELFLLTTTDHQSHQVRLMEMGLDGQFRRAVVTDLQSIWSADAILDADADGRLDVLGFDAAVNGLRVLLSNGDGTFRPGPTSPASASWRSPKIADFNLDRLPDLLISDGERILVALGKGNGAFQVSFNQPFPYADCQVGDFDGDGMPDLAYMNFESTRVELAYGDGMGKFTRPESVPIGRAVERCCSCATPTAMGEQIWSLQVIKTFLSR